MGNLFHRSQQRIKAMTLRQVWYESVLLGSVVGVVHFCFDGSLWHALATAAVYIVVMLCWWYWLKRS